MGGKENRGGLDQHALRNDDKPGLAQRSQNQLNQKHAQRRGRPAAKSRRRGAGYHNQKRHGPWQPGPQRQMAWARDTHTQSQSTHWFQAPDANTPYGNQQVMQPHRYPAQPATPSYASENSMRYVYATPGTQLATDISAMVRRNYHIVFLSLSRLTRGSGVGCSKCIHLGPLGGGICYSRQAR